MIERLIQLFQYEIWANRRALASIQANPDADQTLRLFSHILAAQEIWLSRLHQEDTSRIGVWGERNLEECKQDLDRLAAALDSYLAALTEADGTNMIPYRATDGQAFQNTVNEILTHLAFHSHYHRGQIAARIRDAGGDSAKTDLIFFLRERSS